MFTKSAAQKFPFREKTNLRNCCDNCTDAQRQQYGRGGQQASQRFPPTQLEVPVYVKQAV